MSFSQTDDSTLVIRLSGAWTLKTGLPSAERLREEVTSAHPRRVAFDTGDLAEWDSAVVVFLAHVREICKEANVELDPSGLPEGVRRLLSLSEAVPEKAGDRKHEGEGRWLDRLGVAALDFWRGILEALAFLGEATVALGRFLVGRARVRRQDLALLIQECGANALPIVTLISILVGMILAFVGAVQLERFGAQIYVADLVAIAMVREMGCVMTGIIMAGRTGSGFAAQLGSMKVTQEIDAFTTLGIPPMEFLVLPRLLALILMMPLLTIYSDVLGILGGLFVSVGMLDLTPFQYLTEAKRVLTLTNCATGVGKSFVFGALIAFAGCLRGMQSGKSSAAVGEAATSAVVFGIVLIIVADGIFAVVFNILDI